VPNEAPNAGTAVPQCEAPVIIDRYWLAKHAYLCAARGQVVDRDLKRNKFLSVTSLEDLDSSVEAWLVASRSAGAAGVDRAAPADLAISASPSKLANAGVFTARPAVGKVADAVTIPRSSSTVSSQFGIRPRVKLRCAITVGRAWLTTRAAHRCLSTQHLVEKVQKR